MCIWECDIERVLIHLWARCLRAQVQLMGACILTYNNHCQNVRAKLHCSYPSRILWKKKNKKHFKLVLSKPVTAQVQKYPIRHLNMCVKSNLVCANNSKTNMTRHLCMRKKFAMTNPNESGRRSHLLARLQNDDSKDHSSELLNYNYFSSGVI